MSDAIEVGAGRRAPYSQVGDWVMLANISRNARLLYWALQAHVNQQDKGAGARPSRAALADILGYTKTDSVDPLIRELATLGAVAVERGRRNQDGSPAPNRYVVHETPPDGYSGHESLADYYRSRAAARAAGRRGVAPSTGVPPHTGPPVARSTGVGVAPSTGYEQDQVEQDQVEPPPPTSSRSPVTSRPESDGPQEAGGESAGQDPDTPAGDPADAEPALELVTALPWPSGSHPDPATRRRLAAAAGQCLAAGHSPAAVTDTAAAGIPGARQPAAVVLSRLRSLAEASPDAGEAARTAERDESERLARTPHRYRPGRSEGYCGRCGRHEVNRVHPRQGADVYRDPEDLDEYDDWTSQPAARCEHGRRPGVCLECAPPAAPAQPARAVPASRRPVEPAGPGMATLGQLLSGRAA